MGIELVPWIVNLTVVLALAVGLGRLGWLFLSPVPKPVVTVDRRRWLRFSARMPALFACGCLLLIPCGLLIWWLKHAPHGWQNIVPIVFVYALGSAGAGAIFVAVVVQEFLVSAHKGGNLEGPGFDRHRLRNMEALVLCFLGIVLAVLLQAQGFAFVDPKTATATEIDQYQSIVRAFTYWLVIMGMVQFMALRSSDEREVSGLSAYWRGVLASLVLYLPLHWIGGRVSIREYEIDRFVANRDATWFQAGSDRFEVPLLVWQGNIVILVSAAYAIVISAALLLGIAAARRQQPLLVGVMARIALFVGLAALFAQSYLTHTPAPDGSEHTALTEVVLPLLGGIALAMVLRPLWQRLQHHLFPGNADTAGATARQLAAVVGMCVVVGLGIAAATALNNVQLVVVCFGIAAGLAVPFNAPVKALEPSVTN